MKLNLALVTEALEIATEQTEWKSGKNKNLAGRMFGSQTVVIEHLEDVQETDVHDLLREALFVMRDLDLIEIHHEHDDGINGIARLINEDHNENT